VVTEGAVVLNSASVEGGGLYIEGGPAVNLTGLHVWLNTAVQGGGGIYIHSTSNKTTLLLNHISGNTVTGLYAKGAGVSAINATDLEMMGNLIDLNDATGTNGQGGGVFFGGSTGLVQTNWIINNTAAGIGGGGVKVSTSSTGLTIRGNWFQGNSATVGGGLYVVAGAAPTVDANTFVTNTANVGGGIELDGAGAVMLTNNILAQNTASGGVGGGVWIGQSPGQIINNTIADNTGDGVWFTDADGVAIVNNIIAGNSGHEIERDDVTPTTVYTAEYNCLWDNSGGLYENIDPSINDRVQDPKFVGAGLNLAEYYHIQDTSPVSEAGSASWAPMHDIDWDVRLLGGGVSMGADEIPVAEEYHNSLPLVMKSY
jgi:parallel beta-helix repeat protein